MEECVFCNIANNEPEKLVWQNEAVAAFKSISPQAPVHLLVVPKRHLTNFDDVTDPELAAQLVSAVQDVAAAAGVAGAYRVHINTGKPAGQVVMHLHIHILGKLSAAQLDDVRGQGL